MWTRAVSKNWIIKTCGEGWLKLVDEVYDNLPEHLSIVQTYQKWGVLMFDMDEYDPVFEAFLEAIQNQSARICEKCGAPGTESTINGWIYTRCDAHSK